MEQRHMFKGALVLTLAAIVSKVLSAFYRIPYQNIAGDIGFYIYQQIYPFYGMFLALSTYGYPVAISKLIAERKDRQYDRAIALLCFYFLLFVGIFFFLFLYAGASFIAQTMGDEHLRPLIQAVSFSFLLLPFTSTLRGYFQGRGEMIPTAASQVAEQFLRVGFILFFSYMLLANGYTVYEAGAGAMFGSLLGSFGALFVLTAYMMRKRRRVHASIVLPVQEKKRVLTFLAVHGFTICLANMVLIFTQFIDSLSLLFLLQENGLGHIAKEMKGIYDRGQPFIQLGTVVATSFSLALVPALSMSQKKWEYARTALTLAWIVGLGASVGLICILKPTNVMLFKDASGLYELSILAASIVFTSLTITWIAILQGMNRFIFPMFLVFIGMVVKWMLNVMLVPMFYTVGAAVATLCSYIFMCLIPFVRMRKEIDGSLIPFGKVMKAVQSAVVMAVVLSVYVYGTNVWFSDWSQSRLFSTWQAIGGVFIGGATYIIMVVKKDIFSKDELDVIPFGRYVKKSKHRRAE